jgi:hypothetical protein
MKDVYAHATIRSLATSLADDVAVSGEPPAPGPTEVATPGRTPQYVLCGALQLLFVLGYSYGAALVVAGGYEWISAGSSVVDVYLRSVLFKPRLGAIDSELRSWIHGKGRLCSQVGGGSRFRPERAPHERRPRRPLVAYTRGVRRMTLTYPEELHRARTLLWVVTGEEKRDALRELIDQDPSTPSGRPEPGGDSLILADRAAAPDV